MKQVPDPSAAVKLPKILDIRPAVAPPLDPGFRPPVLALRQYRRAVERAGGGLPLVIGVERENGLLSRFETQAIQFTWSASPSSSSGRGAAGRSISADRARSGSTSGSATGQEACAPLTPG